MFYTVLLERLISKKISFKIATDTMIITKTIDEKSFKIHCA